MKNDQLARHLQSEMRFEVSMWLVMQSLRTIAPFARLIGDPGWWSVPQRPARPLRIWLQVLLHRTSDGDI